MKNEQNPFFSIVIPTRNRATILQSALRSCMAQTFENFEIIVSNNCSNDSTVEVIKQFDCKKLKYFKTPNSYNMIDSWTFALSKANGYYAMILGDDDALTPNALKYYNKEIIQNGYPDIFSLPNVWYGITAENNIKKNHLKIKKLKKVNTHNALSNYLNFKKPVYSHNHLFFKQELLKDIRRPISHVFPDYSLLMRLLLRGSSISYSNYIGLIHGYFYGSAGQSLKKEQQKYKGQYRSYFQNTPFDRWCIINGWAETMLRVLKEEKLNKEYTINWVRYFTGYYSEIIEAKKWQNVSEELKKYRNYMLKQNITMQTKVYMRILLSKFKRFLKKILFYRNTDNTFKLIDCSKYDVNNIFECACKLEEIFKDLSSSKKT